MNDDLIRRSDAIEAITYSHLDNLTREERIAHINAIPSAGRLLNPADEYRTVVNAVDSIRSFLGKYEKESGTSYWLSKIDGSILLTDWGYVKEGLMILQDYCLELMKGAGDE